MKGCNLLALLGFTAILSTTMGYVFAQGQQGLRQAELAVADLGPHFECMEGMVFKMSRFEMDPHFDGGPPHNHMGRPGVFYVLDGSIVEHQNGTVTEYRAGEGFVENADLTKEHRLENPSDAVATVVYTQIVPADR